MIKKISGILMVLGVFVVLFLPDIIEHGILRILGALVIALVLTAIMCIGVILIVE